MQAMFSLRPLTPHDQPFLWEMLYLSLHVPDGQAAFPREIIYEPNLRHYVENWGLPGDLGHCVRHRNCACRQGDRKFRLKHQLAPAWTTDWLSEKGRRKLEVYGIAPPQPAGGPARCPLCKSANVERISQFGSTPCKAQWRCRSCLEPFDYFKCL